MGIRKGGWLQRGTREFFRAIKMFYVLIIVATGLQTLVKSHQIVHIEGKLYYTLIIPQ